MFTIKWIERLMWAWKRELCRRVCFGSSERWDPNYKTSYHCQCKAILSHKKLMNIWRLSNVWNHASSERIDQRFLWEKELMRGEKIKQAPFFTLISPALTFSTSPTFPALTEFSVLIHQIEGLPVPIHIPSFVTASCSGENSRKTTLSSA